MKRGEKDRKKERIETIRRNDGVSNVGIGVHRDTLHRWIQLVFYTAQRYGIGDYCRRA